MSEPLRIAFHGAARTVTGSRHLLRFGRQSWLFDCGLYQGRRDEADRINRTFDFEPAAIDGVIVSHAHIDHTGNLGTLVARGFRGPIHLTAATGDLSRVMLPDSASLMERDVLHVNKHAKGRPPRTPLHTLADVEEVLTRFVPHGYHERFTPFAGCTAEYFDAGHILGSALTVLEFASGGRTLRVGMSGDLGRARRPILRDPEVHAGVDVLVMESTYGDRLHPDESHTAHDLAEILNRTIARGGRVIVPAFAVGRAQELVAILNDLIEAGTVPSVPVYVDSPMARQATAVFVKHPECFDEATAAQFAEGKGEPFGFARLRYVGGADESKRLNDARGPMIIIAASGMCEGGRVLHHLLHGLGNERNTVLFVGYQGEGTLGRRLRDGADTVNVYGEPVRVRAEIAALDGFSAHADQQELCAWVARLDPKPRRIFLVHGEEKPALTLADVLRARFGVTVDVPTKGQEFDLWT